ncbi:MAG: TIGR01906 family membrane protein [Aggregatilineales bacterium]
MFIRAGRLILTLVFPILLVIIGVRLVMTPIFLQFEYNRPDFPADYYGLTREERLYYAPFALDYLILNKPLDYLADLHFDDGTPLFNARELRHMYDVQLLTRSAFVVGLVSGTLAAIVGLLLVRTPEGRIQLRLGLRDGALLTIGLILTLVLMALFAWDVFFTRFHELFFESDTWYFLYSDTLIRLFPEQFWFDAAILVGVCALLGSIITLIASRVWSKSAQFKKN